MVRRADDRGRTGLAVAQTAEHRFSNVLFYGVVLCLAYLVFRVFEPFLVPLGWAAVFGVIFYSLNKRFERKWGAHAIGRGDHRWVSL